MNNKLPFRNRPSTIINAWALYDWANSVYPLVITSTILPIYYIAVTSSENNDIVNFLGFNFVNTALYSYAISFAFLIITFISPILSGIADYKGNKKTFMKLFCYLGAISCMLMYFFESNTLWIGIVTIITASVGYSGSIIFYNAYLPEITHKEKFDNVSAKGFALGYIGSSLLLIFNLTMITFPDFYGITDKILPAKVSFVLTGIWWIIFSQLSFYFLPSGKQSVGEKDILILKGFEELKKSWGQIINIKRLKFFLLSYFFYNMGVQTVMYVATLFGDKELGLKSNELIISILIIQFVAVGGAYLFSFLSSQYGNINSLITAIFIWIIVCIGAYFVYTALGFYILAFIVGLTMGGIQSLSRSTFTKMLPVNKENNSYFSCFDITEKSSIVLGTATYGLIEDITGNMRNSIFALIVFFVLGLIVLIRLNKLRIE